jgi:glycolate oxidase FAD binding subunit
MTTTVGSGSGGTVVVPTSVAEVAQVLEAAAAAGTPVRPAGAGAATAPESGIVISTRELRGLEIYEPADLTLTAAAGTTLGELEAAVAGHGQFLPFDPPHAPARSLGGLVATGAGGPLSSGYGAPRDHVLGVTLVTGAGKVLELGGRVMKNVAGFDLVRLVVGSHGTLGVIVSASIRVFPKPEVDRVLVLHGDVPDLVLAGRAVATASVVPASAALAGSGSGSGAKLVVRLHGRAPVVDADQAHLEDRVGESFQVMEGEAARTVFEWVRDACSVEAVLLGLSALPARLPELLAGGGDGGFVADVMTGRLRVAPRDTSDGAVRALVKRALDLGGSASLLAAPGELSGVADLPGPTAALTQKLRRAFDPHGILSKEVAG